MTKRAEPNRTTDDGFDANGLIVPIDGIDWEFFYDDEAKSGSMNRIKKLGWYAINEHGEVTAGLYPDPDDLADAIVQNSIEIES